MDAIRRSSAPSWSRWVRWNLRSHWHHHRAVCLSSGTSPFEADVAHHCTGVSLLLEYGGQVVFARPRFFPQMNPLADLFARRRPDHESKPHDLVVAVILMFGLEFIVHRTKIVRRCARVSFNLPVARLMGINTDFVIAFTFALGSALAAVAGVLWPSRFRASIR